MLRNWSRTLFSAKPGNGSPSPHHHHRHDTGIETDQHSLEETQLMQTINRGEKWLDENKQTFSAVTENGITFKDNFVNLLILEQSKRWDYVDLRIPPRRWNYFGGKPVIVPEDYPDDNDTNAVAFSILKPVGSRAQELLDEILQCENQDGIIQVHLDPDRPRVAPEVSANILTLFYTYNRGHEVQASLRYLETALAKTDYEPSRYYFMPEPLFFFVWRLLRVPSSSTSSSSSSPDPTAAATVPDELQTVKERLITRVQARIGAETENALCPAIRLLVCQDLGIENEADLKALLALQEEDGSFGMGWYVRYGSCGIKIAHRGFACVMAVQALKAYSEASKGDV